MQATGNILPKEQRLCGKTNISNLMSKGKWGAGPHIKYCFLPNGTDAPRLMVAVPKRNFKRAVKRNLLKRRMREAFRTRKNIPRTPGIDILLFYQSTEILGFQEICSEVEQILKAI